uniref:Uncharacterized protein n=1 Tax=Helianthus annuus TaxID=4232 RepID=A0A251VF44_HELAN
MYICVLAEVCQRLEHDLEILGVAAIEDRLQDICIEKFLEYFWWCWDRLKAKCSDDMPMPSLFHLWYQSKVNRESNSSDNLEIKNNELKKLGPRI